jgi:glycosyltransferase involved in cell wall biosynthesis
MGSSISVVILVRNHRQHIAPCLQTVAWADEIILINDGSSDGTLDIARRFDNVRIFDRALGQNWSAQMNYGIDQASGEWVLQLDVDERVPRDLAEELRDLANRPDLHAIAVRILGTFLGCLLGHEPSSPYALRMVRKGHGRFEDRRVHARLEARGTVAKARSLLVHLGPFPTVESFWSKNILYARVEAQSNVERGERLVGESAWSCLTQFLLKPVGVFLQKFLGQGFWRRGVVGLHYALMRAIGYYMVYVATWERQRGPRDDLAEYCRKRGIPYLDEDPPPDRRPSERGDVQ